MKRGIRPWWSRTVEQLSYVRQEWANIPHTKPQHLVSLVRFTIFTIKSKCARVW